MWSVQTDIHAKLLQSKHIFVGSSRIVTKRNYKDESNLQYEKIHQYYYHTDHLNSVQTVTDYEGRRFERLEYTPYGELWIEKRYSAIEKTPFRFTGKELDAETGLYYYGARYLDPKYSRWLSTDPALGEYIPGAPINEEARKRNGNLPGLGGVYNTVNLHLYHYAGNNPVKYIDPDGRAAILSRPINSGTKWYYNLANFVGTKFGIFHHWLVDRNGLDFVEKVAQYSGSESGITYSDKDSPIRTYTIKYSNLDDAITEKAIKNVIASDQFGNGDKDKQKQLYKVFSNDCKDFTTAVFNEYKSLWMQRDKENNTNNPDYNADSSWDVHYKDITKQQGETVDFSKAGE